MPGLRYLEGVATLRLEKEACSGCGTCREVCPHGVFGYGSGTASIEDLDGCMECGACALNCPTQAIEVESGVGCAWAMIHAALRGRDMDSCSCGGLESSCCGGEEKEEPHPCCEGR